MIGAAVILRAGDLVVAVIGPFSSKEAALTYAANRQWNEIVVPDVVPLYDPSDVVERLPNALRLVP